MQELIYDNFHDINFCFIELKVSMVHAIDFRF